MIRGFYSASIGLRSQQTSIDVLSNNIANLSTAGYKPLRASFADLLYENMNSPQAENAVNTGHGARVQKTDLNLAQGPLMSTERNLDFAIIGDGFFAIRDAQDNLRYTRDGSFQASRQGDEYFLVTASGEYVLDRDEEPISLFVQPNEDGTTATIQLDPARLGVFQFANPYALILDGANGFLSTDAAGERTVMEDAQVKSGVLEGSGVDIADQMVKVIEAQKAFSFNSRMVQISDEIEQTVNGLRQ